MNSGAGQLAAGAKQLQGLESLGAVSAGISQLSNAVSVGTITQPSLISGSGQLEAGLLQLKNRVDSLAVSQPAVSTITTYADNTAEHQAVLDVAIADGNTAIQRANQSIQDGDANVTDAIEQLQSLTASGETVSADSLNAVLQSLYVANASLSGVNEVSSENYVLAPAAVTEINVPPLKESVNQLYAGAQSVNAGVTGISTKLQYLADQTSAFPEAANGVKALNAGFEQLTANNNSLISGADVLSKSVGTLSVGAMQLKDGSSILYAGTTKLVENSNTLNSGASALTSGATQIHSGASQLYDGSIKLGDGLTQLNSGSETLASSLTKGADTVSKINATDSTVGMFASPINEKETKITDVANNGHAMAPYMMSVGLWVGCLAFCLMYPLIKYRGKLESGFNWWLSKASVLYLLALVQAICMIVLLHLFDGFTPLEMAKTMVFACLTSAAFMSIMYFFNVLAGKVGSFIMLIFMVLQLAGSAGTYPVELSPSFVSVIHNWMPFTYSVNAFRSTIAAGESILPSVIVMFGLVISFSGLTVLAFWIRARKKEKNKTTISDFLEEKGFA